LDSLWTSAAHKTHRAIGRHLSIGRKGIDTPLIGRYLLVGLAHSD
jgi:hypothetical protein